ncbi:hypothetical protein [Streptomyces sp. NPDC020817]
MPAAVQDRRAVVTDPQPGMFAAVAGDVLFAGDDARLAPTRYWDWLATRP